MTTSTNISKIIENNWEEVQEKMGNTWRKLSQQDLKGIKNIKDLMNKMMHVYEITEEDAEKKIDDFIKKHNLETNVSRLEELRHALQESAEAAKSKMKDTFKHSADVTREKTEELTEYFKDKTDTISGYIQDNPLKVLGLGVLAGIAIKKLLSKNEES